MVGDEDALGSGSAVSARVESSYIINLRDLDMKHVKDFTFAHGEYNLKQICICLLTTRYGNDLCLKLIIYFVGYIEPVMVILHERELTWAGRVSWKHHTCMISALSISTTLKQHPLIWSAVVSFELYKHV